MPWIMLPWIMLSWIMLPWIMLPWIMLPWIMLPWIILNVIFVFFYNYNFWDSRSMKKQGAGEGVLIGQPQGSLSESGGSLWL